MIITIDGAAACGKSFIGSLLAKNLQGTFVDSGLMYRAATIVARNYLNEISPQKSTRFSTIPRENLDKRIVDHVKEILSQIDQMELQFSNDNDTTKVLLTSNSTIKTNITDQLHSKTISYIVPSIARIPEVRDILNYRLKESCTDTSTPLIIAGRDMWEVFKNKALISFFIATPLRIRAKRRVGSQASEPDILEMMKQIKERDKQDMHRNSGKLLSPTEFKRHGVIMVDNSKSVQKTLTIMESYLTHILKKK